MEQLNGLQNAFLGTLAGSVEVCCDQPIVYWKNASQQLLPFTLNPKYIYRGLGASLTNVSIITGLQFFGAGKIRSLISNNDDNNELTGSQILLSAFGGGALSGIACGPMECIMIQQQKYGKSLFNTTYNIIRNQGLKNGLFRGLSPAIAREGIFTAGYLGIAPIIEGNINYYCNNNNHLFSQISAAMICGFIETGLSHPLDTIKTCMQGDIEQLKYTNIKQTFNHLCNNGGIKRIYHGFGWRYFRTSVGVYIILRVKENLAPIMYPTYFKQ